MLEDGKVGRMEDGKMGSDIAMATPFTRLDVVRYR